MAHSTARWAGRAGQICMQFRELLLEKEVEGWEVATGGAYFAYVGFSLIPISCIGKVSPPSRDLPALHLLLQQQLPKHPLPVLQLLRQRVFRELLLEKEVEGWEVATGGAYFAYVGFSLIRLVRRVVARRARKRRL
jgi:hypothetical protein